MNLKRIKASNECEGFLISYIEDDKPKNLEVNDILGTLEICF